MKLKPEKTSGLGHVSRRSRNVFAPEKPKQNLNLMTSELFYAQILNTNNGSLRTRSFRRIHLSVFKYRLNKNGVAGLACITGGSTGGLEGSNAIHERAREA